jgi:septal ring factor EnvC (AmiA/AmiB activator)
MATTRGKQISANISNLKAELNLLRAELDKLVKEGASFEEINKKLGVTYENLTNKIAASEAALIKYANANKGNVKRNEELGKSVQKLTQQSDSLRASFNNVASVVQTSVNEAISRNTVIVKKNEAAVEEQANSYKNLRAQVGGYFKGILQQNKVDTQAVNQKERLATATTSFGQAFRTAITLSAATDLRS